MRTDDTVDQLAFIEQWIGMSVSRRFGAIRRTARNGVLLRSQNSTESLSDARWCVLAICVAKSP